MLLTEAIDELGDEPVTIDDVKVSARIEPDITELDGQIATLIESARLAAEHECERLFLPRTVRLGFSAWPGGILPVPPEAYTATAQVFDGEAWAPVNATLVKYMDGGVSITPNEPLPPLPEDGSECVRVDVEIGCPANVKAYITAMACHQLTTPTGARLANPPAYLAGLLDRERNWQ